jgi:MoaA/NifB/PqqE/SkfB family radical SAM enzyme
MEARCGDSWLEKGNEFCGNLLEEAVEAIREAEARQGAEMKVRLMEIHCKELEGLADQVEKQAVSDVEPKPLIELGEEIEYKKDNVVSLAQTLKENIPNELKERVQRALQDSTKMARVVRRKLGDLRARLEFRSFDSEAGSYRGPMASAMEAAPEGRPLSGVPRRNELGEGSPPAPADLAALLRG